MKRLVKYLCFNLVTYAIEETWRGYLTACSLTNNVLIYKVKSARASKRTHSAVPVRMRGKEPQSLRCRRAQSRRVSEHSHSAACTAIDSLSSVWLQLGCVHTVNIWRRMIPCPDGRTGGFRDTQCGHGTVRPIWAAFSQTTGILHTFYKTVAQKPQQTAVGHVGGNLLLIAAWRL